MSAEMSAEQLTGPADGDRAVPLCVDLDGTLIKTDLFWESSVRLLKRNPLWLFALPIWWLKGRAHLKRQIAARSGELDPACLPYHEPFLEYLRSEHLQGRTLILATASDRSLAQPVADYIDLFCDVLASDGKTNLRGAAKCRMLVKRYGERGFDYAGNSSVDLAVWRQARAAIVVNSHASLVRRAAKLAPVAKTF